MSKTYLTEGGSRGYKAIAMELKPLGSRALIELIKEEKTTESGIIIPEAVESNALAKGKVLSVGPGKATDSGNRISPTVKEGDMVLFRKHGAQEVDSSAKKYVLVDEDDILAIIT